MSLMGKIIEIKKGEFGFENIMRLHDRPLASRQVWPIVNCKTSGYSWVEPGSWVGKEASCRDGQVSCYLGNGNYFTGIMPQGGSTKSILVEDIAVPCPKVKSGVETRYYNGQWQKLLKTGWKAA